MNGFILDNTKNTLQIPACDKVITSELSGELILPDYLPEVKRLIRVTSRVAPMSRYIIPGSVSYSGTVNFEMLYTDNEGSAHSVVLGCDYEFECELGAADREIGAENIFCDAEIESVSARPVGPRKFIVKGRLRSRVRAFYDIEICEKIIGTESERFDASIERLKKTYPAARIFRAAGEEIVVTEDIPLESGDSRIVCSEGNVIISDVSCADEGVNCRGEIIVRVVLERSSGDLYTVSKRIPIAQTVAIEGAHRGCECRAWGCIGTVDTMIDSPEGEGRSTLVLQVSAVPEAQVQENIDVTFSEDAYSSVCKSECDMKNYVIPYAVTSKTVSTSFSQSLPLSDAGVSPESIIIDTSAAAKIESVEFARGRHIISGKCQISLLTSEEMPECSEFEVPFSCELEASCDKKCSFDANATVSMAKCRIEGENLSVEADVVAAISIYSEEQLRAVEQIRLFGDSPYEAATSSDAVTVYYPDKDESVWDVAKKYHISPKKILTSRDPAELFDVSVSMMSLGMDYVIFEG